MNLGRWIDPRVEHVRVANVESYMLRHGWKRHPYPGPELLVFGGRFDDDGKEDIQLIPSSERMRDYRLRVVELITSLSVIEDRHPVAVLDEMLEEHATRQSTNGRGKKRVPKKSV